MKNKKRIIIAIIVAIPILMILTDVILVKSFKSRPIFAIKNATYWDGGSSEYIGIGYKVIKCNTLNGDKSIHLGFYNLSVSKVCNNDPIDIDYNDYEIVDETEVCAEALEEIYRDDDNIYYLSCIKSSTLFLKYNNGDKITIKDALNNNKVTFEELLEKGLEVYKYPINDIPESKEEDKQEEQVSEEEAVDSPKNNTNNSNNGNANSNASNSSKNNSNSSNNNGNNSNNNNNANSGISNNDQNKTCNLSASNDFPTMSACMAKGKALAEDVNLNFGSYSCDSVLDCNYNTVGYHLTMRDFNDQIDNSWRP